MQREGIDFEETFSPVARFDTIRTVLSIAANYKWKVYQFDVKSAFLNGVLEEEVYVQQPKGYEVKGEEMKVYRLRKALYGLKQAPRAWYERIDTHFNKNGFRKSASEATLYVKTKGAAEVLLICLYVDDLIYTGNSVALINNFKKIMVSEFEMTDLGEMSYFLGLEVRQSEDGIFISQHKYVKDLLEKYNMKECNAIRTPMIMNQKFCLDDGEEKVDVQLYRSLVGSLLYLTNSRPDILQATALLSRFMQNPSNIHFGAAKRILRYLKGTRSFGLWYSNSNNFELLGFSDSDWAGSIDDRKSTTGYLFMLGSNAISWCSKKQPSTALSSSEAEYMAVSLAACQAIWLRRILGDMKQHQEKATTIFCDNQSTISMTKNPVHHNRTRHIDTRHHYIRELVNEGSIKIEHCNSQEQVADLFTKPLSAEKFTYFRGRLGVTDFCIKGANVTANA
ncbi:UNVERIFIED_CONTAM: Retrovirus-related Pol polyprotein from transposon TNT 1-94 [Sesamum radiatum]|uniref:Retrovirus-related Pol polyprotein from transposon TNT 1-94 n=1 Tax=Sesamum radiatum TaxID=300843 RepID=A0AAW2V3R6_SESRA